MDTWFKWQKQNTISILQYFCIILFLYEINLVNSKSKMIENMCDERHPHGGHHSPLCEEMWQVMYSTLQLNIKLPQNAH